MIILVAIKLQRGRLLGILFVANLMDALSLTPTTDHTRMHRSLDLEIWSLYLHMRLIFKDFILHILDLNIHLHFQKVNSSCMFL